MLILSHPQILLACCTQRWWGNLWVWCEAAAARAHCIPNRIMSQPSSLLMFLNLLHGNRRWKISAKGYDKDAKGNDKDEPYGAFCGLPKSSWKSLALEFLNFVSSFWLFFFPPKHRLAVLCELQVGLTNGLKNEQVTKWQIRGLEYFSLVLFWILNK